MEGFVYGQSIVYFSLKPHIPKRQAIVVMSVYGCEQKDNKQKTMHSLPVPDERRSSRVKEQWRCRRRHKGENGQKGAHGKASINNDSKGNNTCTNNALSNLIIGL